jgi:hypothetical protein
MSGTEDDPQLHNTVTHVKAQLHAQLISAAGINHRHEGCLHFETARCHSGVGVSCAYSGIRQCELHVLVREKVSPALCPFRAYC